MSDAVNRYHLATAMTAEMGASLAADVLAGWPLDMLTRTAERVRSAHVERIAAFDQMTKEATS